MAAYTIKVVIVNAAPSNDQRAREVSLKLTREFGADGWEPAAAYPLGTDRMVVVFKKLEE